MIVYENDKEITFILELEDISNAHGFIHELNSYASMSQSSGMKYTISIEHKEVFVKLRTKHFGD